MYADVHCHLDHALLRKQLDDVVGRARTAGLGLIITAGVTPSSNDEVLDMARRYPDIVRCSLGMYPLDALGLEVDPQTLGMHRAMHAFDVDAELRRIESMADKCVAVGEVGMDFKFTKDPAIVATQKEIFAKVIATAERMKRPLIVHSRSAEEACIEMLECASLPGVVMHCFGGKKSLIKRGAEAGFYFSVPPVIKRLQHFQVLCSLVPLEQLLTETDAPWLPPEVGMTNEPKNVTFSVDEIAKAKRLSHDAVKEQVWKNCKKLFTY